LQQFIAGFVIVFVVIVLVTGLMLRRKYGRILASEKKHLKQFEELSKLTGGLAHEIKNPLSTIKINLKLISEGLDKNDEKLSGALRKIGVIQKETGRVEQILEDFLRYAGRTELQARSVDINELMSDMADFYSAQACENSITIRLGLCKKALVCKVDETMLKQVILNLFINAQQAMENGGELIIRTDSQQKEAIIEISDTGAGIKPSEIDRIFDAYYSSRPSGRGLGLPTVKKIIEAHNGSIRVSSEVGKGASFRIRLPLQKDYAD